MGEEDQLERKRDFFEEEGKIPSMLTEEPEKTIYSKK